MTAESATFDLHGVGLSSTERAMLRELHAAWALAQALVSEHAFMDHVARIRAERDVADTARLAWDLAGRYGAGSRALYYTGGRRKVITHLMLRASSEATVTQQRRALFVAGAVFVNDDATVYRLGDAYFHPLIEGARYIARAGAGRCLVADGPADDWCSSAAAEGSAYCRRHDGGNQYAAAAHRRRASRSRTVFDLAARPVLSAPLPTDLWDAFDEVLGDEA